MRFVRRLAAVTALSAAVFGATGLLAAPAASAHPLGNFTINHYDGLMVSPGHVRVTYVLDMAEIPTFQQMPSIDANGDGTATPAERQAWAARQARSLAPLLALTVDGRPVGLSVDCSPSMVFRPGQGGLSILRMVATLDGTLPGSGALAFRDGTYAGRIGWKEITARGAPGVTITGATVPATSTSDQLLRYPTDLLKSPLDVTEASLSFASSGRGAPAPACPSGVGGNPTAASSAFASLITWRLTPWVLALSLALAFAFGALHALGPGHGKTIAAAYLVGSGAKARQAMAVGGAVSLMHTASVLTLGVVTAAVSSSFHADSTYPWLTLLTGLVALSLGAFLLIVRVRAKRRGLDPWHGHTHPWDPPAPEPARVLVPAMAVGAEGLGAGEGSWHGGDGEDVHAHDHADHARHRHDHGHDGHDHGHDGRPAAPPVSRRGLAALAVAGGILPSPTALVVLLGAIEAHRVGFGLALIVAFSLGLAAALIAIALLALRARTFVATTLGTRTAGWVPIVSAVVILGFGAYFFTRGALQVF